MGRREEIPYLALDIGAGSGRAMLGFPVDDCLEIREIHRFPNKPVPLGGVLYWDFLSLWDNVLEALKKCAAAGHTELKGIGIDAWNVDFGLVDRTGALLHNPVCYRHPASARVMTALEERIGAEELYGITGFGPSPISGLSRLLQFRQDHGEGFFAPVDRVLPMPDLLRFFLCGTRNAEETILWGTQLMDVRTRVMSSRLFDLFGIPARLFSAPVASGTVAGELLPGIAEHTGVRAAPVIAVAGHDTISALVPAVRAERGTALLCTGTWFILGRLFREPVTSGSALRRGFLNEIAVDGLTFFAKNMMGFYLLEDLIRRWRLTDPDCAYETLFREAADAPARGVAIDVNDPEFFSSTNAARSLAGYFARTGQPPSPARGAVVRGLLEGLADSCRAALADLEELTGEKAARVLVLGGGARNALLCRLIEEAVGCTVIAGPAEATVEGNIGMQMIARGERGSLKDLPAARRRTDGS